MYVINLLTIIIIIIFTIIIQVTKKTNIQTVLVLRRFNFVCFRDFSFANALIYGVIFFLIGTSIERVNCFRGASFISFLSLYVSANKNISHVRDEINMVDRNAGFVLTRSIWSSSTFSRFTFTLSCTEKEGKDFEAFAICHRFASQGSARPENAQYANTWLSRSTCQRSDESFSNMLS